MNFFEKLTNAARQNNSLLCVGLDPNQELMPDEVGLFEFNKAIIEATIDVACAYKPNLAIYEAMGAKGLLALEQTLEYIREADPNIPIIGDGKRGDIGPCSQAYRRTSFDTYKFDAVTINPYMGLDALKPFLEHKEKGVFVLCRTSNPSGTDIQELMVLNSGERAARPLYEVVAELAQKWNSNGNVGLVVGATYPAQIRRVRQICPNMLFLIPGVGAQGGDVAKTVHSAVDNKGAGFIINVSRQIMNAAKTSKAEQRTRGEAIRKMHSAARNIRDEINSYLPIPPKESQKRALSINGDKARRRASPQEEASPVASTTHR